MRMTLKMLLSISGSPAGTPVCCFGCKCLFISQLQNSAVFSSTNHIGRLIAFTIGRHAKNTTRHSQRPPAHDELARLIYSPSATKRGKSWRNTKTVRNAVCLLWALRASAAVFFERRLFLKDDFREGQHL
jgi:hypothetical protein